jgi:outer membrane protein TolC
MLATKKSWAGIHYDRTISYGAGVQSRPACGEPGVTGRGVVGLLAVAVLGSSAVARAETRLSLADAIDTAGRHRTEVVLADLDVQLARLGLLRAGLKRFRLTLDGRVSEQVERLYVNAPADLCASVEGLCQGTTRSRLYNISADLSIPVFTGFGLEATWSEARQVERAAYAARRTQLHTLALEVARAYWTVRGTELQQQAMLRALERRSATATLIKARADAGIAPKADLHRAEIAVLRQQADLADLTGRVSEARAVLAAALQVGDALVLTDDPAAVRPQLPTLGQVLETARKQRPELERATAEAEAQRHRVSAINGDFWPHLSLFGRAEARNEAFGVPQDNLIGHYAAGIMVSWLAFDSLGTFEASRTAEVERQKRALERERLVTVVEAEVRTAHGKLSSALARREPLERAQKLAETTLELLRRRYQSGGALLIEVLEAQNELEGLEMGIIDSDVAVAEAAAALAAAMGGTSR